MDIDLDVLQKAAEALPVKKWRLFSMNGVVEVVAGVLGKVETVVKWTGFDGSDYSIAEQESIAKFIATFDGDTVLSLIAEVKELRKDAERYRWLRGCGDAFDELPITDLRGGIDPEALDAAIDLALKDKSC